VSENGHGNAPTYRIGAVSRLTGVPADTLRVWERRYRVVEPFRSESGTRLYGAEDVGRLTLIKRLVDRGDAISSVANLSLHQLRERVSGSDLPEPAHRPNRPCRVAVLGAALADRLRLEPADHAGLDLVGLYDRPDTFLSEVSATAADLVLFDYPTVYPDQVPEIAHLLARSGAHRAILVYSFATRATLERLETRRILTRRAPVDIPELSRWCLALHRDRGPGLHLAPVGSEPDIGLPIPARRFDDAQLARIGAASAILRCGCPHHLAGLIGTLAAFESYCEGCEVRHPDDAAIHAYLHASTARARAVMETALARVLETQGMPAEPESAPSEDS
jgi:DNA-binding transcriptional MerR regulator